MIVYTNEDRRFYLYVSPKEIYVRNQIQSSSEQMNWLYLSPIPRAPALL